MKPLFSLLGAALLLILAGHCFALFPGYEIQTPQFYLTQPCVSCSELANASQANILAQLNDVGKTLEISAYYEAIGETPSRKPIGNAPIIVEVSNPKTNLKWIYKTYTDAEGDAPPFSFSSMVTSDSCVNLKALYCPFCEPTDPVCGFKECMQFAGMHIEAGYYTNIPAAINSSEDVPVASGVTVPSEINPERYLPQLASADYCSPPPPLTTTPAMCLPLLIIFSLLSGALYLTGKNPFTGFNLGGQRIGKHIQYQARGRGYSAALASAGMSLASTISSTAKAGKEGAAKAKKEGKSAALGALKSIAAAEGAAAKNRFVGGGIMRGRAAAKHLGAAKGAVATGTDTKDLKGAARINAITAQFEARIAGVGLAGGQQPAAQSKEQAAGLASGPLAGAAPRGSELAKAGFGGIMMFIFSQTTIGRMVDGAIGIFQPYGQQRGLFEMMFVSRGERRENDMKVLTSMLVATPDAVGTKVALPDGNIVTVAKIDISKGGAAVITLVPEKSSGIESNIKISVNSKGDIVAMTFTVTQTVTNMDHTETTSKENVKVGLDAKGEIAVYKEVPSKIEGGKSEFVLVDKNAETDLFNKAITATNVALPPGLGLGSNASQLVDDASRQIQSMKEIASSVGIEGNKDLTQIASELDSALKKSGGAAAVAAAGDAAASREISLALGTVPAEAREKPTETAVALGEVTGKHNIKSSVNDAVSDSNIPKAERETAARAMDAVIRSHSPEELARMKPEELKAEMGRALLDPSVAGKAPGEAAAILKGVDFKDATGHVNEGAKDVVSGLKKAGLEDFAKVDMSQIDRVAEVGNVIHDGKPIDVLMLNPKAAMDNPNLSHEVKYLLAEQEHTQNTLNAATQMGAALENGNAQTAALWASHAFQENAHSREAMMAGMMDNPAMKKAVGPESSLVSEQLLSGVIQNAEASMMMQAQYNAMGTPPPPAESPLASRDIKTDTIEVRDKVADGNYLVASMEARAHEAQYRDSQPELAKAWGKVADGLDKAANAKYGEEPKLHDAWEAMKKIDAAAPRIESQEGFKATQNAQAQQLFYGDVAAKQKIETSIMQGDYATAAAECADRARFYRNLGNGDAAKAYETAANSLNQQRAGEAEMGTLLGARKPSELKPVDEETAAMLKGGVSTGYNATLANKITGSIDPYLGASAESVKRTEELAASGQSHLKNASDHMETIIAERAEKEKKRKELAKKGGGTVRDELA
ncbi:MAG: hypothetical protein PHF60_02000 [Candidatus ainarchaeum sp.]|nr:hypothetical protein [Candidatus ainarchaeum sp.]